MGEHVLRGRGEAIEIHRVVAERSVNETRRSTP